MAVSLFLLFNDKAFLRCLWIGLLNFSRFQKAKLYYIMYFLLCVILIFLFVVISSYFKCISNFVIFLYESSLTVAVICIIKWSKLMFFTIWEEIKLPSYACAVAYYPNLVICFPALLFSLVGSPDFSAMKSDKPLPLSNHKISTTGTYISTQTVYYNFGVLLFCTVECFFFSPYTRSIQDVHPALCVPWILCLFALPYFFPVKGHCNCLRCLPLFLPQLNNYCIYFKKQNPARNTRPPVASRLTVY